LAVRIPSKKSVDDVVVSAITASGNDEVRLLLARSSCKLHQVLGALAFADIEVNVLLVENLERTFEQAAHFAGQSPRKLNLDSSHRIRLQTLKRGPVKPIEKPDPLESSEVFRAGNIFIQNLHRALCAFRNAELNRCARCFPKRRMNNPYGFDLHVWFPPKLIHQLLTILSLQGTFTSFGGSRWTHHTK
jgi:hypothetical protein